jgi:hypothetical protein
MNGREPAGYGDTRDVVLVVMAEEEPVVIGQLHRECGVDDESAF